STYLQFNLGFPRDDLWWLYLFGGMFSFVGMRMVGRQVDRHGAARVALIATSALAVVMLAWFVKYSPAIPVVVLFVGYMLTTSVRGVAYQTVTSKVPAAQERAGYMSLQSSVSHMAAAIGSVGSSYVLIERADGSLGGMDTLAISALAGAALVPWILWKLELRLKLRAQEVAGGETVRG
ncbi:MAG TPA: MFS transporter, partial [Planctomycetota bacterium]|nr:MFS transporter [Planctomycetota bacterium]